MFDRPTATPSLSLVRDGTLLRGALLSLNRGQVRCDQLLTLPLVEMDGEHVGVKLLDNEESEALYRLVEKGIIITVLGSQSVLTRQLEVKLKKEKEIDAVLPFQTEPLLPFPIEEAVIDRMVLSPTAEGTRLIVIATKKEQLAKHLEEWNQLNIEPEVVSCEPAALANFCSLFAPSNDVRLVIHMDQRHTTCLLVKEGKPITVQSTPIGGDDFVAALQKDDSNGTLATVDFMELLATRHRSLSEISSRWIQEVTRLTYSLTKQYKEQEISEMICTGISCGFKHLNTILAEQLKKRIIPYEIPEGFEASPQKIAIFAVAIGAALSGLPQQNRNQINFRQLEFAFPHPWRRIKGPLITFYAASILLTVALVLFANMYTNHRENSVRMKYNSVLNAMNRTFPTFEKEYAQKTGGDPSQSAIALSQLSSAQMESRLDLIEKELQGSPEMFPLQPNVPRVSDLLAWLSSHPKMRSEGNEGQMQIESLQYTLVKRPEIKKKQEKYQVKVELEFTSPTPKLAREFHDALISPNEMVDPKAEVKWSSNRGRYKASFFLKDKTAYLMGGS